MGICNKVAGILAVFILGSITLKNIDALKEKLLTLDATTKAAELDTLAQKVVQPYIIITIVLTVLAIVFYFIHLPDIKEEEETINTANIAKAKTKFTDHPNLILGAIAIFFYVGVEVISYDTFSGFGESLGYKLDIAKSFASYTGYGLLVGYLLSIVAIPKYISQRKALLAATLLSLALVLIATFTKGSIAVTCFALLGFSNSVMWPAIWPLALTKAGRFTKIGSALLVMGIVGGAVLPPLYGKFAELMGSKQEGYLLMIPCYIFILYYALKGYKTKS